MAFSGMQGAFKRLLLPSQESQVADPLATDRAMGDVVGMTQQRRVEKGVDYEAVITGNPRLIPDAHQLEALVTDYRAAIDGRVFVS
jgi:hypothetical protein